MSTDAALPIVPVISNEDKSLKEEQVQIEDTQFGLGEHVSGLKPVTKFAEVPRMRALRMFWKVAVVCLMAAWTAIMDGYLVSVPGSIVANPTFIAQFGTEQSNGKLVLDPRYVGGFTAVQSVGQIVGMLSGGYTSDLFGRRFNFLCIVITLTLGVVLEMVAKSNPVWLVARLMAGWGTGLTQTTVPVYISEIAPTQLRGTFLVMYNFFNGVGGFASAIALQIVANEYYKQAIYTQWVFLGVMYINLAVIPESPWFYLHKGGEANVIKAKKALTRLNGKISGYDVDYEFEIMNTEFREQTDEAARQKSQSYLEIFRGTNLRRTFIAFLPLEFQGMGGLSFVLSYTTYFFQLAGYAHPFQANAIVKTIQLTAQIIAFWSIERIGRRRLLVGCGIIMTVVCLVLGILGCFPITDTPGGVLVALFCIWTFSYASSCGPIGWAYTVEISTPRLRAKTAGFAAACTALIGVFSNFVSPIAISALVLKTGFIFFATALVGVILMYFCVPEVSGRSYAELDELFERKIKTSKFPETVCECSEKSGAGATIGSSKKVEEESKA